MTNTFFDINSIELDGILRSAKNINRNVVTKKGVNVILYDIIESHPLPIVGKILSPAGAIVCSWDLQGKCSGPESNDLSIFNVTDHFNWRALPEWANKYLIYDTDQLFYCTNVEPKYQGSGRYLVDDRIRVPEEYVMCIRENILDLGTKTQIIFDCIDK